MANPQTEQNPPPQLTEEDEERLKGLFSKLDVNKDGRIEINELAQGLKAMRVPDSHASAEEIIRKADQNEDAEMDYNEFLNYMTEHEMKLKLAFDHLDKNKDGKIDSSEVQSAMNDLGFHVDDAEAQRLTKRIDRDGDLTIEWEEFRDAMQLSPKEDLEDLVIFWRQNLMIDIGDMTLPPEFTKKEKQTGLWWRHLVAGGIAGAVSRTATAPLDRLKIMFQVHGSSGNMGVVSTLKNMISEGGVRSMWRGNGISVIKITPESALKFAAYEQVKRWIKGEDASKVTGKERFIAGACAGAFSQSCIFPMETIKTRLALGQSGQYNGILDCAKKMIVKEGVKSLYKGYVPNLIGIVPYAGIDLAIYETLKNQYIASHPGNERPGPHVLLGCGTVSCSCGLLVTFPMNLVRTKLQAQMGPAKLSMTDIVKNIVKNEGARGLYRGILPNYMKVIPAVGISYIVYERCKVALGL